MGEISKYLGKFYYKCEMCDDMSFTDKYQWEGNLIDSILKVCAQCAKRETGGKRWLKKSQQLKKLKQK